MAIDIFDKYGPTRANAPTVDYPTGSIKNESVPGANDGTPLDQDWGNDYAGFDAALFAEAGITPDGNPDTAVASQRLEAIKALATKSFDTVNIMLSSKVIVGTQVQTKMYNSPVISNWSILSSDPGTGYVLEGTGGNAGAVWFQLISNDGDVRHYGADGTGTAVQNQVLAAAAADVGFAVIPTTVTLRVSDIDTTLIGLYGRGRLIWDNDAVSIITYEMPDNFRVDGVEIETIYRNRLAIKALNLKVNNVTEIQSDARTDQARYSAVEWQSDGDIVITNHETVNTGLRVLGAGVVTIDFVVTRVNHVGEGPDGNNHGVDGIKASGLSGLNISNHVCYGTSRDVIDSFIGGGACNITNVWADGFYFNEIELKSEGTTAPDNQITPHDINISNIYIKSGGQGTASNWAALFIFNQSEGSILNSPRRVNVSNWNSRLIGTTATGTYHAVYAVGAYDLNFVNVNLLSAKDNGLTAIRCNSVKLVNSNIHGDSRGASFDEVNDIKLENSTLGEDLEAATVANIGAFFSGTNDGAQLSNSSIKGTSRALSGESATVNKLKAVNSVFEGPNRVDIFDSLEFTACTLDAKAAPGGNDVFLSGTSTPSTKLKIIGGTLKNGRFGINQQSLNKLVCLGVDFENLTAPMGGVVANNNRRIVNCLSDGAGSFPTPSGDDVITGNIEI